MGLNVKPNPERSIWSKGLNPPEKNDQITQSALPKRRIQEKMFSPNVRQFLTNFLKSEKSFPI
jgi:hypothetical protein